MMKRENMSRKVFQRHPTIFCSNFARVLLEVYRDSTKTFMCLEVHEFRQIVVGVFLNFVVFDEF